MSRHDRFFQAAILAASKSSFRHRLGCVITKGNAIIESGTNAVNRHQGIVKTDSFAGSLHAELDALSKAIRNGKAKQLVGASLYVVRLMKNNIDKGLALPCKSCYDVIRKQGIKRIYYSDANGLRGEIRIY